MWEFSEERERRGWKEDVANLISLLFAFPTQALWKNDSQLETDSQCVLSQCGAPRTPLAKLRFWFVLEKPPYSFKLEDKCITLFDDPVAQLEESTEIPIPPQELLAVSFVHCNVSQPRMIFRMDFSLAFMWQQPSLNVREANCLLFFPIRNFF